MGAGVYDEYSRGQRQKRCRPYRSGMRVDADSIFIPVTGRQCRCGFCNIAGNSSAQDFAASAKPWTELLHKFKNIIDTRGSV